MALALLLSTFAGAGGGTVVQERKNTATASMATIKRNPRFAIFLTSLFLHSRLIIVHFENIASVFTLRLLVAAVGKFYYLEIRQ
jgi:hypothetical protein